MWKTALVTSVLAATGVGAQTATNTDCSVIGPTVHCDSRSAMQGNAYLGALAGFFQGMAADRARQTQDSLVAAAAAAQTRAAQNIDDLRWKVFLPRAQFAIHHAIDSVPVFDAALAEYSNAAASRLIDLYNIQPDASNAAMLDVVAPLAAQYRQRVAEAIRRWRSVVDYLADSLHIAAKDKDTFWNAAGTRLYDVTTQRIDAPEMALRSAVQPVVDSIGLATMLDSARATIKKKKPPTR